MLVFYKKGSFRGTNSCNFVTEFMINRNVKIIPYSKEYT